MQKYRSKEDSEILQNLIKITAVGLMVIITLASAKAQTIIINEIMYNPSGDDNNKEFIELFLAEPIPLQNYSVGDSTSNDTLTIIKYIESNYAVIVEDGFNTTIINATNASFYSIGATIGNNLNNDQDIIIIYNTTGEQQTAYIYSNGIANNNDFSIERNATGYFESKTVRGTPGTKNSIENIEEQAQAEGENKNDNNNEENNEKYIEQKGDNEQVADNEQVNETEEGPEEQSETNITEEKTNQPLSLIIKLPETLYTQIPYKDLFNIRNNKYKRGSNQTINITLAYNLTKDNRTISNNTIILTDIKASKSAGTGTFTLTEEGSLSVCGTATTSNESTTICKTLIAISAKNVTCDIEANIKIEKKIYLSNEKIAFYPEIRNNAQNFPIVIAYQIKDLFNNTLQKQKETTNNNKKSYTPEIAQSVDVIIIQEELKSIPCDDKNESNNYAEQIIIIKNSLLEENAISTEKLSEKEIFFGDIIKPRISIISKNKTIASIKVYIEDKEEKRLTQTYYLKPESLGVLDITLPITIDENCNNKFEEGTHYLIVEGFNKKERKQVVIHKKEEPCSKEQGASSYEITEFQEIIQPEQQFITDVSITNDDSREHNYTIWSYVYRGPKSYSGDRLLNLEKITIEAGKQKIIGLKNKIDSITDGDYSFKVQIQKDNQKTTASVTRKIVVAANGGRKTRAEGNEEAITSFYTKAKKLSSENEATTIHLFSTIKGEGNYTLHLETPLEKRMIPVEVKENNKTMITAEILPGKNIYVLKLLKGTNVIDTKDLVLYTNATNIITNDEEVIKPSNKITGYTISNQPVYQSTTAKVRELIIPLSVIILATIAWIVGRELKGKLFKRG